MNSLIELYNFVDALDDEKHNNFFNTIKEDLKQKIFVESLNTYNNEKKTEIKPEYKPVNDFKKLQKEREEEGDVCERCSRRDCSCY